MCGPMYSGRHTASLNAVGFPIRTSPGQRSVGIAPELFAATHVLHRLLAPRHPPYALSSLQTSISLTRNCVDRGLRPPLFAADLDLRTFVIQLSSTIEIDVLLHISLRMHFSKNGTKPVEWS